MYLPTANNYCQKAHRQACMLHLAVFVVQSALGELGLSSVTQLCLPHLGAQRWEHKAVRLEFMGL